MNREADEVVVERPDHPWSAGADEVASSLGVDRSRGLDDGEAQRRLREHGKNLLRETRRVSAWRLLLNQFRSLVILLLVAAAAVSLAFTRWLEGGAIAAVIVVNTAIGFFTELKAIRSMESLRKLSRASATVRRDGQVRRAQASDLVPGDVVLFEAGDVVTADMRIIEASKLEVDESTLTGESTPAGKSVEPVEADAPLAERSCMMFKGTTVTRGSGCGVVVATGMETELGRIASLTEESDQGETPLERRLEQLGRKLIWVVLALAAATTGVGLLRGQETMLMVETGVALAVAAIPEGLPIVATLALARGMWRMAERNALLNRLSAVEALGSTSVILTDKTGTLTENQMTVTRYALPEGDVEVRGLGLSVEGGFTREGREIEPDGDELLRKALEIGVLCNNASLDGASLDGAPDDIDDTDDGDQTGAGDTAERKGAVGDPMEVALLVAGRKAGLDRASLLERAPEEREEAFDPDTKAMATFHSGGDGDGADGYRVAVKGAAESVVPACTRVADGDELTDGDRERWLERAREMAGSGLRVLAVAEKRAGSLEEEPYRGLTLVGLVGMLDPPREEVQRALEACRAAGIRVVMVTGDQVETASSIAAELGLELGLKADGAMTGRELKDKLKDRGGVVRERALAAGVFARMDPEQKLRLLEAHQDAGAVVAMTGDGVNDAPALTRADIGVAMGRRGSEAAKQAADMVLRDDDFGTIVAAVEQGRIIFANIRKAVIFMLCTNVAEVIAVSAATLAGWTLPLHPLQILYLNVLTDVFPALALSVGPGSGREMSRRPRGTGEALLGSRQWWWLTSWATVLAVCVLASMHIAGGAGLDQRAAVTVSFLTLGFGKLWFSLNLREPGSGLVRNEIVMNRWMWWAVALCAGMLLIAVYAPGVSTALETARLPAVGWGIVLGVSLIPVALGQVWIALRSRSRAGAERPGGG